MTTNQADPWPAANFFMWTRRPRWYRAETAALLLGREPQAGMDDGRDYQSTRLGKPMRASPVAHTYGDLFGLLEAAEEAGELNEPERPANILRWADRLKLSYPEELRTAYQFASEATRVEAAQKVRPHSSAAGSETEIALLRDRIGALERENISLREQLKTAATQAEQGDNPKRVTSYQKAVIAMAWKHYRFTGNEAKSEVPEKIATTARLAGIAITDDTVRSILRAAKANLSWQPPERSE